TSEKHFRRVRGRKVELMLSDGSRLTGRVGRVDGNTVTLVVRAGRDWVLRQLPVSEIAKGVVQVEFSPPAEREMELAQARVGRTEAGG
ncbi:MAG: ribosome maturation factor RimP, partial [Mycobacterium sp.]